jgi:ribosomal protein L37AE/L43A
MIHMESERIDPTKCPHTSVNRVLNAWFCNNCGAPFKPVKPEHNTRWPRS